MALVSSGKISLRDVNTEMGLAITTQRSLNDSVVRNLFGRASGEVRLTHGYGKANRIPITVTISTNQQNYLLNTAKAGGYQAGITDLTFVINNGVLIDSSSTSAALNIDTSWAAGDVITIVNNGTIAGKGGNGGNNGNGATPTAGGVALNAGRSVRITNNGTIAGGGGGGGAGQGGYITYSVGKGPSKTAYAPSGGGGGGQGSVGGSAGAGSGTTGQYYNYRSAGPGGAGSISGAGAGGPSAYGSDGPNDYVSGGYGGAGGGFGAAGAGGGTGTSGGTAYTPPYNVWYNAQAGGAGGACVTGNANITWLTTGTRFGALT